MLEDSEDADEVENLMVLDVDSEESLLIEEVNFLVLEDVADELDDSEDIEDLDETEEEVDIVGIDVEDIVFGLDELELDSKISFIFIVPPLSEEKFIMPTSLFIGLESHHAWFLIPSKNIDRDDGKIDSLCSYKSDK